jgi:undecaprenyl-diphosphatase
MELVQALVLGIVQGLTEFIPVSSSAHLVLVPWLLGWPDFGLTFDTTLHLGTLAAVLGYFRQDWLRLLRGFFRTWLTRGPWGTAAGGRLADPDGRLAWLLVVGSVPAALAGYLLNDPIERLFASPIAAASFLFATAAILMLSERLGRQRKELGQLGLRETLLIGLAQAAAIVPGISRSGATIAAGLGCGVRRDAAARFSFLLSMPVILGAGLFQLVEMAQTGRLFDRALPLVVGLAASAISGYVCIRFLLSYLRRGRLYVFAAYCTVVGAGCLLVAALR